MSTLQETLCLKFFGEIIANSMFLGSIWCGSFHLAIKKHNRLITGMTCCPKLIT